MNRKISVSSDTAFATVGGACIEFCLRPEVLPSFVEWLRMETGRPDWPIEGIRSDLSRILQRLPRKADLS